MTLVSKVLITGFQLALQPHLPQAVIEKVTLHAIDCSKLVGL